LANFYDTIILGIGKNLPAPQDASPARVGSA
jgi:hypothetical protein